MASRSLGTLTLDVVANVGGFVKGMGKAERVSEKRLNEIRNNARRAGTAIAGIGIAAAAAATAIVKSTIEASVQIQRLSTVANASAQEFQRYAVGAKLAGIEQDKLADILKDVNDRVGEFLQTGSGPMIDFFENIAPKVGITADAFRDLSGPQALQLFVTSLEKAGASQQEMTFYLEALASDATLLLPLLLDNGEGFRILGEAASEAGAIISDEVITRTNDLRASTFLLDQSLAGVKNKIAEALIPVLGDMAVEFGDITDEGKNAIVIVESLTSVFKGLALIVTGLVGGLDLAARGLAGLAAASSEALEGVDLTDLLFGNIFSKFSAVNQIRKNLDDVGRVVSVAADDLSERTEVYQNILSGLLDTGSLDDNTKNRITEISNLFDELSNRQAEVEDQDTSAGSPLVSASTVAADAIQKARIESQRLTEQIDSQVESLQFQAETLDESADAVKLLRLEMKGASSEQLKLAEAALSQIAAFEKKNELQSEFNSLVMSLRTDQEVTTDRLKEQVAILDQMNLSVERRAELESRIAESLFTSQAPEFEGVDAAVSGPMGEMMRIDDAQADLEEWYSTQLDMLENYREQGLLLNADFNQREIEIRNQYLDQLQEIEEARGLVRFAATADLLHNLTGLAEESAGKSSGIYKAAFVAEKAVAIARAAVAIQTGIAQAAAAPFPQNLAAMASVAAATAGIVANIRSITVGSAGGSTSISAGGSGGGARGNDSAGGTSITGAGIAMVDQQGRVGAIRIINAFDPASVADYIGSDAGSEVIVNVARMNSGAMREAIT